MTNISSSNNRAGNTLLPRASLGDQTSNVRRASQQLNWMNNPFTPNKATYIDLASLIRQILMQLVKSFPAPNPAPAPAPIAQPVYGVIQPPDIQPVYGVVLPPDGMVQPVYGVIQPDPIDNNPPIQAVYGAIQLYGLDKP
ncbi:MAG: hypothetical protein WAQ53_12805 [Thiofilum sp.]|uniref:hypothetical protein n=1 Tax=Thiofilum sp. TaxID=2212733 RepID=UPI0025E0E136|nr:hypothetical protein [Thiofilum sp.]MBK8453885.1 hypothetical protein [Thiofilum sp.]